MKRQNSFLGALGKGLRGLSPDCREASRLQARALDRTLSPLQRIGLRLHLVLCKWCRRYGDQLRFLRGAAHEHQDNVASDAPRTLSPMARDRIRRALRDLPK